MSRIVLAFAACLAVLSFGAPRNPEGPDGWRVDLAAAHARGADDHDDDHDHDHDDDHDHDHDRDDDHDHGGRGEGDGDNGHGGKGDGSGNTGGDGHGGGGDGGDGNDGNGGKGEGNDGNGNGNAGNDGDGGDATGGGIGGGIGGRRVIEAPGASSAGDSSLGNEEGWQRAGGVGRRAPGPDLPNPFAALLAATGPLGWDAPQPANAAGAERVFLAAGTDAPAFRDNEVSALGLTPEALERLEGLGFSVISERRIGILVDQVLARLRTPPGIGAEDGLALAQAEAPGVSFDLSHLYRLSQGVQPVPVAYGSELVGFFGASSCPVETRIGLIDTAIARHPALAGASIRSDSFVDRDAETSVIHGTAIASILVGDVPGVLPLVPGAGLFAANVFAYEGDSLRSDVTAIIAALDWMDSQRVKVVNMSLMGPPNALLERGVMAAAQRGQILLAAAGNFGPGAPPAYPAAYGPVIAVAAVDARSRPYPHNNRGRYVEISAPGVDIWGADARGGETFWTGTSFAVPFAVGAVARDVATGRVRNINDAREALAGSAQDLGAPGRDPIFGYGLLRAGDCS
ncbi:MAG TPA: S8 family serine peptidase [Amaricoccus sp.]|uniref:S8 family serine peptidase n=1 Tax=Amaricoccus sp. TaxID=1872485 RepID=UPI002BAB4480|nr:S8 family serine peptidase [Amaricoccus sp.]HMR52411.1 S8 family serine peptidase [Amaricoccus sp.]HMT99332.1 S8 family serine peptidase [Amaricoccus sp.]